MSNKTEREEAKRIGAKPTKNSGRGINKGDMVRGYQVIDLKEVGKSFKLDMNVWSKICMDAATYSYEKVPMLVIKFANGVRLAVLDLDDLQNPPQ